MSHGDKIIVALQDLNDQLESGAPIPVTVVHRESTPDGPLHTFRKDQLVMKPLTDAQRADLRRQHPHPAVVDDYGNVFRDVRVVRDPGGYGHADRTFAARVVLWCALGLAAVLAAVLAAAAWASG